ncbi:hypothetical protein D3C80_1762480 [compost metagenome]
MTAGKQTVAGAYAKIERHEAECALRYEALGDAIGGVKGETEAIKKGIRMALGMLATIVFSLIAWLASQLYGYVQRDIAAARPAIVAQAPATVGLAASAPVISRP